MLPRNGEEQQFIINEAAQRKLLQPLTKEKQADLVSPGATHALMKALQSPASLATAGNAAAYMMWMWRSNKTARLFHGREV